MKRNLVKRLYFSLLTFSSVRKAPLCPSQHVSGCECLRSIDLCRHPEMLCCYVGSGHVTALWCWVARFMNRHGDGAHRKTRSTASSIFVCSLVCHKAGTNAFTLTEPEDVCPCLKLKSCLSAGFLKLTPNVLLHIDITFQIILHFSVNINV